MRMNILRVFIYLFLIDLFLSRDANTSIFFKFAAGLKYSFHWFNSNHCSIQYQTAGMYTRWNQSVHLVWTEALFDKFCQFPQCVVFLESQMIQNMIYVHICFFFLIQKNKGIHIILSKHQNSHFSLFCLSFLANCLTDTIQTRKQKFYKGCIWDQLAFHFRFNPRRQCCVDH